MEYVFLLGVEIKRIVYKLFFTIFLAFGAFSAMAKERVTVISNIALPPYSILGETAPEGFEIDLLTRIGEINDWEVVWQKVPFQYFFQSIEEGKADLLVSSMISTPEREQKYTVSEPYSFGHDAVMLLDPNLQISNDEDLARLKIAGTRGSLQTRMLLNTGFPEEQFVAADSFYLAFRELLKGTVDGVVGYDNVLRYLGDQRDMNYQIYLLKSVEPREIVAIATKDKEVLVERFDNAMLQLKNSGEYQRLAKKWGLQ